MENLVIQSDRNQLHQLLDILPGTAPRYTSYPPANHLQDGFQENDWITILEEDLLRIKKDQNSKFALYLHVPFCHSLCFFCACNRIVTKNQQVTIPYLKTLNQQIERYAELLPKDSLLNQLHIGGGTPNFLKPKELESLLEKIQKEFNLDLDFDCSIELDPRTCTAEHLEVLAKNKCTRISIGVQDFNTTVQKAINRIQGFELTKNFVDLCRQKGINQIGIDMIYGLPLQDREVFRKTMEGVNKICPNRVAVYGYAHVPSQAPAQKKLLSYPIPNSHERLDLLLDAVEFFTASGYKHLGIDHFVLENDPLWKAYQDKTLTRSFMGYNTGHEVPVLGLGVSAISIFPSAIVQNEKEVNDLAVNLASGHLGIAKGLILNSKDQLIREIIKDILSLGDVHFDKFQQFPEFSELIISKLEELKSFSRLGLINLSEQGFTLTSSGQVFARVIAKVFDYRIGNSSNSPIII